MDLNLGQTRFQNKGIYTSESAQIKKWIYMLVRIYYLLFIIRFPSIGVGCVVVANNRDDMNVVSSHTLRVLTAVAEWM